MKYILVLNNYIKIKELSKIENFKDKVMLACPKDISAAYILELKDHDYNITLDFNPFIIETISQIPLALESNSKQVLIKGELGFFLDKLKPMFNSHNIELLIAGSDHIDNKYESGFPATVISDLSNSIDAVVLDSFPLLIEYLNERWYGNYFGDVPLEHINKGLFTTRSQCHLRCLMGSDCKICEEHLNLGKILQENGFSFIKPAKKSNIDKEKFLSYNKDVNIDEGEKND